MAYDDWSDGSDDYSAMGISQWSDDSGGGGGYSGGVSSGGGRSQVVSGNYGIPGRPGSGEATRYGTGPNDWTWAYGSPNDMRKKTYGGSGGSSRGGSAGGSYWDPRYAIPAPTWQTLKAPTAPQFKAIEYAPPEEDKSIYAKTRAQEAAPGLRASRQAVTDALMMSRNLENPNARGQVTRGAIEGYGQNVEGTMARASSAGRAEAARKRAEQLNLYNSKYQTLSQENMLNYQNKLNEMMMDWGESQAKRNAEYQLQAQAFGGQPQAGKAMAYNPKLQSSWGRNVRQVYNW